ncbi:MAG: hypothetical protein LBQ22_05290 [Bacteroidales bacterium]|jgi:hypothetical protein|nr:hypothetical protein [Bacteroidales bacterium]
MTGDANLAHQSGMSGLKMGAGIGVTTGFAGGYYGAKQTGINPWTGKSLTQKLNLLDYDFSPDANGNNVKMYRGITGHENSNKPLFLADSPEYARSYSADVVEITINKTAYYELRNSSLPGIETNVGINYSNGVRGGEYVIHNQQLKIYIIKIIQNR